MVTERPAPGGTRGIMRQAIACRLGATFALAAGSLGGSLIDVAPAEAQTASACVTVSCVSAQRSELTTLLAPFTTLVGTNAFAANFQIEGNIYQNATYAQRVQAAQNAILADAPTLIWYANNNPSPLAANVLAALTNSNVMNAFNNAYVIPHTAAQPTFLKGYPGFTTHQN